MVTGNKGQFLVSPRNSPGTMHQIIRFFDTAVKRVLPAPFQALAYVLLDEENC